MTSITSSPYIYHFFMFTYTSLSLSPKTTNSSYLIPLKQSIYEIKFSLINGSLLQMRNFICFQKSFLFLVNFSCLSLAFSSFYIVTSFLSLHILIYQKFKVFVIETSANTLNRTKYDRPWILIPQFYCWIYNWPFFPDWR
jgi:hypothetical protein